MDIAIVGCGYGGAVLLNSLLSRFDGYLRIHVYDPNSSLGRGYAYQVDDQTNLLNRPTNLMYFSRKGDFPRWLGRSGDEYAPRVLFGEFVRQTLISHVARTRMPPLFFNEEVTSVARSGARFAVTSKRKIRREYDVVVLATGNEPPDDLYGLRGAAGYVVDPYPTSQFKTMRGRDVAILGSRLSAIDAAVALLEADPYRRVSMFTRKSGLPHASDPYEHLTLRTLSEASIRDRAHQGRVTLETIGDMLDTEFRAHGIPMSTKTLLGSVRWQEDNALKQQIYSVLASMNDLAPTMWGALPNIEKLRFRRRWSSIWNAARVPIPPVRRQLVDGYVASGRLTVRVGLRAISVESPGFSLVTSDGLFKADMLINATGPGTRLSSPLYRQMFANGCAVPNSLGGVDVALSNCRVQGPTAIAGNLFAMGHPTSGVFFSVSNIDVIQLQATKISDEIGQLVAARKAPDQAWKGSSELAAVSTGTSGVDIQTFGLGV